MTPQLQRNSMAADGRCGDCHRTCIAMILNMDRDDVPHFMDGLDPMLPADHPSCLAAQRAELDWLAGFGLGALYVPFDGGIAIDDLLDQMRRYANDVPFVLGCSVGTGADHSVVVHRGVVHDPLGDHGQPYAPTAAGVWWLTIYAVGGDWQPNRLQSAAAPASTAIQEDD